MVMETNKPVRIVHIMGPVISGGVESVVMNYYRNIDRTKVQFDFIIDGHPETYLDEEIKALGGRVYHVEAYEDSMLKNMLQTYKVLRRGKYEAVHSHVNTLSVFPLAVAWLAEANVRIAHNHSTVARGEGKRAIIKYMLRPFAKAFANHYSACSEYAGSWLFGKKSTEQEEVKVFRNAIDISKYAYKPQVRLKVRQELGVDDKFVVGHVGRFAYQKNHEFLIDVFQKVHTRNSEAVLMLVGSGNLEKEIRAKVDRLGIQEAVLFLGVRHDVPELLQAMDAFVFPSHFEGLGLVAIEAQAAGLKTIVSTEIPKEANITELFEYCSLQASLEEWAEKILASEGASRVMTEEAIRRSGYEIKGAAQGLVAWYESILQSHRVKRKSRLHSLFHLGGWERNRNSEARAAFKRG